MTMKPGGEPGQDYRFRDGEQRIVGGMTFTYSLHERMWYGMYKYADRAGQEHYYNTRLSQRVDGKWECQHGSPQTGYRWISLNDTNIQSAMQKAVELIVPEEVRQAGRS
ncbi:hypothetical protein ACFL2M_02020 [Patescibacteria group bacterium]